MSNVFKYLNIILSFLIYLLGGIDNMMKSLLIMMVIDYITGVIGGIYNKKLNSKIGLKGILKKFGYLCIVATATIIDELLGQSGMIRTIVIYFFVANDGISILENLAKLNINIPSKLIDSLEQLKNKGE